MFLQWIRVENYRNLQEVTVQFHKQYNYFVGENAIGKSNLLDLLSILADTKGFDEKDFFEIHKPIRITMEIELEEAEQGTYWDEDDSTVNTITLVAEQLLQEVYPRLYRQTDTKRRPLPLALFRKICYVSHRDTSIASLYEIRQSTLAGLEKHPGFELSIKMLHAMLYGILYGDLLMTLVNQCRTYEVEKGAAQALADRWTERLGKEMGQGGKIRYRQVLENYRAIVRDFGKIQLQKRDAVKVGVVGEIFVKYSPLGNNNLEQFLVSEGAEVVVPGLIDFCLYSVYNNILDHELLERGSWKNYEIYKIAYKFLCKKKNDMSRIIAEDGHFTAPTPFEHTVTLGKDYIHTGVKMGEGWLLTSEMLELSESGVKNIVCTQPFGCLPNHICGKGMMKPIKERNPDVNIVAIDYDAGATKVNQENRLKLMLANARANLAKEPVGV